MFTSIASSTARPAAAVARRTEQQHGGRRRVVAVAVSGGLSRRSVLNGGRRVSGVCLPTAHRRVDGRRVVTHAGAEEKEGAPAGRSETDVEDIPPWERRELEKKAAMEKGGLPWPAYLGLSVIVCIASIGSCFELNYGNPIFGVVYPDSFAYKPILYWFIGTGFPLTAFLWTKGIAGANEAAELQDKLDGY